MARRSCRRVAPRFPLLSLPDALLLECLKHLSLQTRPRNVALVNKRLRGLCLEPQLLGELEVTISGGGGGSSAVVQRTRSLLGLLIACGRHVRKLDLDVRLAEDAPEQHRLEVAALVSSCLAACATAGQLQELRISEATPLGSTAWLQGLTNLHTLSALGNSQQALQLEAGISRLTALRSLSLAGITIELDSGRLPASLTYLRLSGLDAESAMPSLDNLTGLQHLALCDCGMSDESMQQLAALPLQDLDLANSCLPPCLSALTGLTSLAIMQHDAEDLDMLDASLPCLTGLSRLALTTVTDAVEQLPACLPQLRSITRFCLVGDWQADIFLEDAMPRGAWVARLRWLGLPYHMAAAAAAAGVLSRAALLDYLCSSGWPEKAAAEDGAQQQEEDGRWEAFWNFLARHPPLRCFAVDTNLIEGSSSKPNDAAVDALLDMHWRRPGLQLRRLPRYAGSQTFWDELLECEEIPEGAGAP